MAADQEWTSLKIPKKVRLMLETLYFEVVSLREFCLQWEGSHFLAATLLKENDKPSYKSLLLDTVVCALPGARRPASVFSFTQSSHQHDLVLHAVEKLRNRDGHAGNLLTLGINKISENPSAQVCMSASIECVFPNQHISKLQYPAWHTLLSRIGDDMMLYLLTTRSMFQPTSSNCYVQICGSPVYDLWPYKTTKEVPKKKLSAESSWSKTHTSVTPSKVSRKRAHPGSVDNGPPPKSALLLPVSVTEIPEQSFAEKAAPKKKRKRKKKSKAGNLEEEKRLGSAYNYYFDLVRKTTLYTTDLRERFPRDGILSDMRKPNYALKLLDDVFTKSVPCINSAEGTGLLGADDTSDLESSMNVLVDNHRKTFFKGLLNYHCPVDFQRSPAGVPSRRVGPWVYRAGAVHAERGTSLPVSQLLEQHTSYRQVYLFLRACLYRVLPANLLGSSHNRNVLWKNLKLLIGMGKFEKLSLGMLMKNLKVCEYSWLSSIASHRRQVALLARWMYWLFGSFLFSMLRAFFYITETTVHKNKILYYRKSLWKALKQDAVNGYLRSGRLEPITKSDASGLLNSGRSLGVSRLRFLPKASSLRPILNLGRKQLNSGKSINQQLDTAFRALTFQKDRNPKLIGCAIFGMDDLYTKLKAFVCNRKHRKDTRPLYFVKVDINSCFESINQQKLFSIVRDIFSEDDEFLQRKFATVVLGAGKMRRSFIRQMSTLSRYTPDFLRFIQGFISERKIHDAIIVDQVMHFQDSPQNTLKQLEAHLFKNIIEIGGSYFLQKEGITQGSKVSVLLCNSYYGRMEQEHLSAQSDELLIRQVDDFLFLTPHIDRAKAFLSKMLTGFPDYNCTVNPSKTVVNFPCEQNQVVQLPQQVWFPWCGLLLNTVTLEIAIDYSCYAGLHIGDTVSAEMIKGPGLALLHKLLVSTKPKCHPIFLDPELNSARVIRENLYKCIVLAAMRFHHLCRKLPRPTNVSFFEKVMLSLSNLIHTEWKKLFKLNLEGLIGESIYWMVLRSFRSILIIHQGAYQAHIQLLKGIMARLQSRMGSSTHSEVPLELQKILH